MIKNYKANNKETGLVKQKFLRLAETKLDNLGYKCYYEKQQYRYMGELHNLQPNEVMVAIRKQI